MCSQRNYTISIFLGFYVRTCLSLYFLTFEFFSFDFRITLQYRAPEEYDEDYLNEQIDVFSFGNNIFGLLTGLWVFYDVDDDGVVQRKVIGGTRAYIDPRWKKRSYIESKLVEVMEKCWIPDVDKRIDIFGAVRELREIKKDYERRKAKNRVGEK